MNLAHWLDRTATSRPDRPAIFHGPRQVADYGGFRDRAAALAAWLGGRGIGPGDRVGLFAANAPDYLIWLFGIWWAGAAAVPINARLHPREVAWIADNAGTALILADDARRPGLTQAGVPGVTDPAEAAAEAARLGPAGSPAERRRDDLAWLFYTSGTTGRPKGVMITHGMLMATSLSYLADVDTVEPADAAFYAAPMSHGAGLYALVHVLRGARHIVPASGGFDPAELLEAGLAQGPLSMFLAPTMVRRLIDAAAATGADGAGLKTIVYGGGPMYVADIIEALDRFGPRFVQIYGQGECPMCITTLSRQDIAARDHPRWRERLASVGRAQSVVEVAVCGPDGRFLPTGEVGEIVVRGAPVMPGYWKNPQATAAALCDGWLRTGDVGRIDGEGYVTLIDRAKDVIISGGANIYPREVEEVLLTHPGVHEVAVVGAPHREWGEQVVAFVVPAPGAALDEAALDALCLSRIARYKRPRRYIAVAELPKNNYGKVLKTELRQRLKEGA